MAERRRHRWYQFSLRTLLVFVLLVSIGLSWLGVKLERARRQREAVERITELGGSVSYDYIRAGKKRPAPAWLCRLLGDEFFATVVVVIIKDQKIERSDLVHLRSLPGLERLSLSGCQFAGHDMASLRHTKRLRNLFLHDTPTDDDTLAHLEHLGDLEMLGLARTRITDEGLAHIESLRKLQYLCLNQTEIGDAGIEHVTRLTSLSEVEMIGTQATPEGVKRLQEALPKCEIVY